MKEVAATNGAAVQEGKLAGFNISRNGQITNTKLSSGKNVGRSVFSTVSNQFCDNMLGLDDDDRDKNPPTSGSVVGLVGRTAIPCVCEVPEASASLLTDEAASVVSDGVKWQSLYLVFLGRYMILAEPERGGYVGSNHHSSCLDTSQRFFCFLSDRAAMGTL